MLIGLVTAQCEVPLERFFFSTEEDFVTQGTKIISDGDLLNAEGYVYMRNHELLSAFEVHFNLGWMSLMSLTSRMASCVLDRTRLSCGGGLTAGDLLATNVAILPNSALLASFKIARYMDLGLDAVHFMGKKETSFSNILFFTRAKV